MILQKTIPFFISAISVSGLSWWAYNNDFVNYIPENKNNFEYLIVDSFFENKSNLSNERLTTKIEKNGDKKTIDNYKCQSNKQTFTYCEIFKLNLDTSNLNPSFNLDFKALFSKNKSSKLLEKNDLIAGKKYVLKIKKSDHKKISGKISVLDKKDRKYIDLKKDFHIQEENQDIKSYFLLVQTPEKINATAIENTSFTCGYTDNINESEKCDFFYFSYDIPDKQIGITKVDFSKIKEVKNYQEIKPKKYFVLKMKEKDFEQNWRYKGPIIIFNGNKKLISVNYSNTLVGILYQEIQKSSALIIKPTKIQYFVSSIENSGSIINMEIFFGIKGMYSEKNYICRDMNPTVNFLEDINCTVTELSREKKNQTSLKNSIKKTTKVIKDDKSLAKKDQYFKIEIENPDFDSINFFDQEKKIGLVHEIAKNNTIYAITKPLLKIVGNKFFGETKHVISRLSKVENLTNVTINQDSTFKCQIEGLSNDSQNCDIYKWTNQLIDENYEDTDFTGITKACNKNDFENKKEKHFLIDLKNQKQQFQEMINKNLKIKVFLGNEEMKILEFSFVKPLLNVPETIDENIKPLIWDDF